MEFDVHFSISGYYKITANSEEEATEIVNSMINEQISKVEDILKTGVKDDNYVLEVLR
jgi:hypothetical protein